MNEKFVKAFTNIMKKEAEKNVNNACLLFCYQPKESKALDKLKKKRGN